MKKLFTLILTIVMVMGAVSAFAADIKVLVNGEEMVFDREPVIEDGTVLVPYRFVAEKLGAKVSWHQDTKSVFTEYNGKIITTQIGNELMFVNDSVFSIEKAPVLSTDRTLVPLEVFKNAMEANVSWDETTSTVTIEK